MSKFEADNLGDAARRQVLLTGAGVAGDLLLPGVSLAADQPPIGT